MILIVGYKGHKKIVDTYDYWGDTTGVAAVFRDLISWFADIDGVDGKDYTIKYENISIELGE